jgi:beta-lactam-binding protein with PASTA domain
LKTAGDRFALGLVLGLLFAALIVLGLGAAWVATHRNHPAPATRKTDGAPTKTRPAKAVAKPVASASQLGSARKKAAPAAGGQVAVAERQTRVPDVRGLATDVATTKLEQLGFRVRSTRVFSNRESGSVVDQAPIGRRTGKGALVVISIAKPQFVMVPDVVGRGEGAARAALQAEGLRVLVVAVPSSRPRRSVTAQRPAAGQRQAKESRVRINVSDGSGHPAARQQPKPPPRRVTVPDLSGAQFQSAAQRLSRLGLLVSVQYVPGGEPFESVRAQSPQAAATAAAHAHVTLSLSRGPGEPPLKTVPDLTGRTLDAAVAETRAAGLRMLFLRRTVPDRPHAGKIVEQTPPAGGIAPRNGQVLVYLGAFRASS